MPKNLKSLIWLGFGLILSMFFTGFGGDKPITEEYLYQGMFFMALGLGCIIVGTAAVLYNRPPDR